MCSLENTKSNSIDPGRSLRSIQSFVLRQGRLTTAQSRALEELEPRYGLPEYQPIDLNKEFGRYAPLVVEIGFGNGNSLAEMAASSPEKDYIGIEVHSPGVGHLLLEIEKRELTNIKIHRGDAVKYLQHCLPDSSIYCLQIFFPDPWHKKKHHKRRLIGNDFLALAAQKIQPHGYIHIATDWKEYAEHCITALHASPEWVNAAHTGNFVARPDDRPLTKFEQRGQRLGHGVWDIMYTRK